MKTAPSLIRPLVHDLHAYVPGEQPKIKGLIKLNTNENPHPPSSRVLAAVKGAVDGRLRLYPNPTAQALREKLAKLHRCKPENIIIGNGSDELLALAVRAFVEPQSEGRVPRVPNGNRTGTRRPRPSELVQYFHPSYSLYPVLADIHGAAKNPVPLNVNFSLPEVPELKRGGVWDFSAALTFVTTPNAPSGRGYSIVELEKLCRAMDGVVVLDEAYVDFAEENALKLALKHPHVIVSRTFSKAYSLCFQRVGYFVAHERLIAALDKIRDSYNVNGLGQIAALATLDELPYYRANFRKIIATREELSRALTLLGFRVLPSETNFILAKPPLFSAQAWLQKLREKKILVRWFNQPEVKDFLRITIGTPTDAGALIRAAKVILRGTH
ncbi:MAG TPA: aminotransferase class I/II-fold pyridoxal phosphate-dependent enzyme [Verrucomicrobiae bacterium]|jgi:histidinol-phosphate aminotransferase|nr:aminotransferase class I/II-fold pyridoxal phosphate-dependent enzyme [Verrucomicrobiae bacterium]